MTTSSTTFSKQVSPSQVPPRAFSANSAGATTGCPLIMGVVNLTPDSFSDGGRFGSAEDAVAVMHQLVREGCDVLDLGAESSRPGARELSTSEEWERLEPVLSLWAQSPWSKDAAISVDTRHDEVMLRSVKAGASWINCIEGLPRGEKTLERLLGLRKDLRFVAMHMQGSPHSMQNEPLSGPEVVEQVYSAFEAYQDALLTAGFTREQIYFDPGIGFGKDDSANLTLMAHTASFASRFQLALGVSRKSWIGRQFGIERPASRDDLSKMSELGLMFAGARLIRTHAVKPLVHLRNLAYGPYPHF